MLLYACNFFDPPPLTLHKFTHLRTQAPDVKYFMIKMIYLQPIYIYFEKNKERYVSVNTSYNNPREIMEEKHFR